MKTEKPVMQNKTNGSSNDGQSESPEKISLRKQLNCGSCVGLVRDAVLDTKCVNVGKLPTSRSCGSHKPDVFTLAGDEEKVNLLGDIANVVTRLNTNDLQILASLLLSEKVTRRFGFKFHQKVYIRVQGESTSNYMSNFAVGYVLTANKDQIQVIGETGAMAATFLNDPESLTIYTVARFNVVRKEMMDGKRYVDPNLVLTMPVPEEDQKSKSAQKYIKSFDEAMEEGLIPKKKRSERGDLVALVSRLGRGHLGVSKLETGSSSPTQSRTKSATSQNSAHSVKFKH